MGGVYGVSEIKDVIDALIDAGLVLKDIAIDHAFFKAIGPASDLMSLVKEGFEFHELADELLELDQDDEKEILAYLSKKLPGLLPIELAGLVQKIAQILLQIGDYVKAGVALFEDVKEVVDPNPAV